MKSPFVKYFVHKIFGSEFHFVLDNGILFPQWVSQSETILFRKNRLLTKKRFWA
jgi:hypothetical protein